MNQRERDELAEYVALIADEYERARHVLDRFPKVYEDQLDEVRHGDETPGGQAPERNTSSGSGVPARGMRMPIDAGWRATPEKEARI